MTRLMLAAALGLAALAGPLEAQVTCRANGLGAQTCVGIPAPETVREPYRGRRFGLGTVQDPVGAENGPTLTPARRADALGNTFLTARDLPPDRPLPGVTGPRTCANDALGNLVCR